MHDTLYSVISEIHADTELKDKIMKKIEVNNMKQSTIKQTKRAAVGLIFAAAIGLSSVAFAISPELRQKLGDIISYFSSDQAVELSNPEKLSEYAESICVSDSKSGYTLTLDNVAADDNFINVFYTISSDKPIDMDNPIPLILCRINGFLANASNNNDSDCYAADKYTYKVAYKYNISSLDIPDTFTIELYTPSNKNEDVYLDNPDPVVITDDQKKEMLYVSAQIDKSKASVNSVTKDVYQPLDSICGNGSVLEKVIFSPFGNQLVITTPAGIFPHDGFALFDENGKSLDILNTGLLSYSDKESVNSLEFINADSSTEALTIVPVSYECETAAGTIRQKTGSYPMVYEVNSYGKIIVTDIRITDGCVEIDYYKDGFVPYDPGFVLEDDNGNNAEPGGKLNCLYNTRVHYDTNSYTASFIALSNKTYSPSFETDTSIPADEIKSKFTTLGIFSTDYIELDYSNAITIDLK